MRATAPGAVAAGSSVGSPSRRAEPPGSASAGSTARHARPIAHQNAPWNAAVAPWSSRDCRATATIAVPNAPPTCWAIRVLPERLHAIVDEVFLPLARSYSQGQGAGDAGTGGR